MAPAYTVACHFHVRADAIDAMKQVIDEVTKPSLSEEGCQVYHWSEGDEDPDQVLQCHSWYLDFYWCRCCNLVRPIGWRCGPHQKTKDSDQTRTNLARLGVPHLHRWHVDGCNVVARCSLQERAANARDL